MGAHDPVPNSASRTSVFGKSAPYKPASQVDGQPANDIYGNRYSHGGTHQGNDLTAHGKNMDKIYADAEVYKDAPAKKVGKVRGMINKITGKK